MQSGVEGGRVYGRCSERCYEGQKNYHCYSGVNSNSRLMVRDAIVIAINRERLCSLFKLVYTCHKICRACQRSCLRAKPRSLLQAKISQNCCSLVQSTTCHCALGACGDRWSEETFFPYIFLSAQAPRHLAAIHSDYCIAWNT